MLCMCLYLHVLHVYRCACSCIQDLTRGVRCLPMYGGTSYRVQVGISLDLVPSPPPHVEEAEDETRYA